MSDRPPKPEGVEPVPGPYVVDRCGPLLLVSGQDGLALTCDCGQPDCPTPPSLRALQVAQPMFVYLNLYAKGLTAALEAYPDDPRAPANREVLAMVEGILRYVRTGDIAALAATSRAVVAAHTPAAMPRSAADRNPLRN